MPEITESPKSMLEFQLGMFLMTLMDFYDNPDVYSNELKPKFRERLDETVETWLNKYEEIMMEQFNADNDLW